ncbi:SRPBCC family protein [Kitasatospora sp. NPDC088346]|uniref:SRPBCC family protein n=1 Tax=Kitasatospora sp. NPDC088346 TaxID=3364073 RepID=UPI0037F43D53
MGENTSGNAPLFQVRAEISVSAEPADVYSVISDLARSGEWSPECLGGEWVVGAPAEVGSVFRGENLRSEEVVSWAPVVRGKWHTHAEVVAAEPGRTFRWAMHDSAGGKQDSVWAFDIEAAGPAGSLLVHHFRMGTATEGIRGITAEMDRDEKQRFFADWAGKLEQDLAETLGRIKLVIEKN